ncbi:serine--tRNA ligase [Leadbettera azotonutricia]|uniref:Serine--tRNA ligase n=1 Tax=Leadbettera azotonutricia (strain ATCC BAA-888 / DSM 13862 / ZAS-9) TaxID=545695 RepID=F5YFM5_LEAAZ|nr:serine--tRNA ligase [Leadbettera azotonutricia]AEF83240.1 serine--tRNA ligase [Leadbettera azotonutricia ZAS-9]
MLDYRFIVDNLDAVKKNIESRYMKADADAVVRLFNRRTELTTSLQGLQQQRNANAAAMKGKLEPDARNALIEEGKKLKESIAASEAELSGVESSLETEARKIPNMAHPEAPLGKEDKDNLEVKRVGEPTKFDFEPADHVKLGQDLDIIDFDSGTKVSGTKFYYLKNEGVFLELGLVRYALDILQKNGFTPFITPDVAKEEILEGIGFNPRGAESNVYTIEGEDSCLVGTAEITLGGYYSNMILPKEKLPLRMAGLSHCFRREAGAAGQFSKGLYRVHQFTKLEMFVYCLPEESGKFHEELRGVEEEIFSGLEIPFRVVDTCTGDLGAPAYRKWDLEAWMPGRANPPSRNGGEWGEVTSTSNCTDYQARRLNIKYKDDEGKNKFVHMLNGTAIAISRGIIAVLENFQQADGSVKLPKALVPYCGFDVIKKK